MSRTRASRPSARIRRRAPRNCWRIPLIAAALALKSLPYERLDQLTMEILFGVR